MRFITKIVFIALLSFAAFFHNTVSGQIDVGLNYKNFHFKIDSFKEEHFENFPYNSIANYLIPPIANSEAMLEIRQCFPLSVFFPQFFINCISFFKDSCVRTLYHFVIKEYFPDPNFVFLKTNLDSLGTHVWVNCKRKLLSDSSAIKILTSLKEMDFFRMEDQVVDFKEFKRKDASFYSPVENSVHNFDIPLFYEVKIHNYNRNFCRPGIDYYPGNPTYTQFKFNWKVENIISGYKE